MRSAFAPIPSQGVTMSKKSTVKKPTAEQLGVSAVVGNRGKTRSTSKKKPITEQESNDILEALCVDKPFGENVVLENASVTIAPEVMSQGVRDVLTEWYEYAGEVAKLKNSDTYAEIRRFEAATGKRWTELAEKGDTWSSFKHRLMLKALREPTTVSVAIPTPPKPSIPVPPKPTTPKPQTPKPATVQASAPQYKPRGEGWNGLSASALGRWMGANGWTKEEAWTALTTLKVEGVAEKSLPTLIKAGRDGFRVPNIAPELAEQLLVAASKISVQTMTK